MKSKFIVAVKDVSSGGIKPGQILGQFRKLEDARQGKSNLVLKAGFYDCNWRVGIFLNGKCLE